MTDKTRTLPAPDTVSAGYKLDVINQIADIGTLTVNTEDAQGGLLTAWIGAPGLTQSVLGPLSSREYTSNGVDGWFITGGLRANLGEWYQELNLVGPPLSAAWTPIPLVRSVVNPFPNSYSFSLATSDLTAIRAIPLGGVDMLGGYSGTGTNTDLTIEIRCVLVSGTGSVISINGRDQDSRSDNPLGTLAGSAIYSLDAGDVIRFEVSQPSGGMTLQLDEFLATFDITG
jgi:hypothetical protein